MYILLDFSTKRRKRDEMRGFAEHLNSSVRKEDMLCRAFYLFSQSLIYAICIQRWIQGFWKRVSYA